MASTGAALAGWEDVTVTVASVVGTVSGVTVKETSPLYGTAMLEAEITKPGREAATTPLDQITPS